MKKEGHFQFIFFFSPREFLLRFSVHSCASSLLFLASSITILTISSPPFLDRYHHHYLLVLHFWTSSITVLLHFFSFDVSVVAAASLSPSSSSISLPHLLSSSLPGHQLQPSFPFQEFLLLCPHLRSSLLQGASSFRRFPRELRRERGTYGAANHLLQPCLSTVQVRFFILGSVLVILCEFELIVWG